MVSGAGRAVAGTEPDSPDSRGISGLIRLFYPILVLGLGRRCGVEQGKSDGDGLDDEEGLYGWRVVPTASGRNGSRTNCCFPRSMEETRSFGRRINGVTFSFLLLFAYLF